MAGSAAVITVTFIHPIDVIKVGSFVSSCIGPDLAVIVVVAATDAYCPCWPLGVSLISYECPTWLRFS
jgi:hypothetical protein